MLHVRWHLFHEFLFVYLFFLTDTDVIMTLLVCCNILFVQLLIPFSYGTALNNAQMMHPLTSGIHDSKYDILPKADILNT